jgi:hypothetical protein
VGWRGREEIRAMALTRTQKRLISEIDRIAAYYGVDHRALVREWEGHED